MFSYSDIIPSVDFKLLCKNPPSGFDYTQAYTDYQKFMFLHFKYPKIRMCPSPHLDYIWHQHMLNPISYHSDCMKWFGALRGHDASLGLTPKGKKSLEKMKQETKKLWKQEFGEEFDPPLKAEQVYVGCYDGCG